MATKATSLEAPQVTVQGHEDRTGSVSHNVRLSLARADEVRAVLIAEPMAPDEFRSAQRGKADCARQPVITSPIRTIGGLN
jgi:outer membrane protein OmpA-like peptidoglycan-associated protein